MSDTIVAVATPAGESALSLIRISGTLALSIMNSALSIPCPTPRHAYVRHYNSVENEILDQVVCIYYEIDKSFTGEEMIEISCHGNPIIVHHILSDIIERGTRLAEPGEFTKRAYLNEKIDLVQAESISELISAKNKILVNLAQKNLEGNLSSIIKNLQSNLITIQAKFEAFIDFPEDDIGKENHSETLSLLKEFQSYIFSLLEAYKKRETLDSHLKVLLVGAPNAGKSTLFNSILGYDRTIVSDVAGTTRDYISKTLVLEKTNIELIDTAGLRSTNDSTESIGVKNTNELLSQADLIVLVIDASLPYPTFLKTNLKGLSSDAKIIIAENKSDLPKVVNKKDYTKNDGIIAISAKNKSGINNLTERIEEVITHDCNITDLDFSINIRHQQIISKLNTQLIGVIDMIASKEDDIIIIQQIKQCLDSLGELTRPTDNEDMLDSLFKNFCIGK